MEGKLGNSDELIKITDLADTAPYSAEYLSLRARQGKLKAQKIGNTWYSTSDAISEYRSRQELRQNAGLLVASSLVSSRPANKSTSGSVARNPWLIKWLAIPLVTIILFGFIPIQVLKTSLVFSMGIINDLSDQSSTSFQSGLQKTVGQPPQNPKIVHNFLVYSRISFNMLSTRIAQPISHWYEKHPFILTASSGNFDEIKSALAKDYGPTGQSFFGIITSIVAKLDGRDITSDKVGKVAGLKTKNGDGLAYRIIKVDSHKGISNFNKGEDKIVFESHSPITNFKIIPTRELAAYRPIVIDDDQNHIEVHLVKPAEHNIKILWLTD